MLGEAITTMVLILIVYVYYYVQWRDLSTNGAAQLASSVIVNRCQFLSSDGGMRVWFVLWWHLRPYIPCYSILFGAANVPDRKLLLLFWIASPLGAMLNCFWRWYHGFILHRSWIKLSLALYGNGRTRSRLCDLFVCNN